MTTRYRPNVLPWTAERQVLARMDVPDGLGPWKDALLAAVDRVMDAMQVEFRRVGTAVNGAGGTVQAPRTVTASGSVASTDGTVYGDTTGGAVTLTLPPAKSYPGMLVCVKRVAGANALTVAPFAGDTIDGGGSVVVTTAQWFHSLGASGWQTV